MPPLAERHCTFKKRGSPPLAPEAVDALLRELDGAWAVEEGKRLTKTYRFPDFAGALAFTDRVGAVAEREQHHPDIELAWGRVRLTIWTHSVGGLSENDFILAAKADKALGG